VLTLLTGVITAVMAEDNKRVSASIAAVAVLALLCTKKYFEVSGLKK